MKIQLLALTLLISISIQYPQKEVSVPLPDFKGLTLTQVKKNQDFTILTKTIGDLNNDHVNDLALVLETKDSIYEIREPFKERAIKGKARILLVFLHKNGKQIVHTQNNKFIARSYEGGMLPYIEPTLKIEENKLIFYYEYTRGSQWYHFLLKDNQFRIVYAEDYGVNGASGDFSNYKYDFENKKLTAREGNVGVDKEKVTVSKFEVLAKALSDFNEMYEWEVLEDHFL
jgi:hypothetical protein